MTQSSWRRFVKTSARSIGFDVIRFHPESSDGAKVSAVLKHLQIDLVLDVGANEGQFAQALREFGYRGRVVSFEPLSSAYAKLTEASRADEAWELHPRGAIGDHDGEIAIHIAGNNVSSSVLPMLDSHAQAAPESRYIGDEVVPIRQLDNVFGSYRGKSQSVYLKVDTQGYEAAVLRGATQTLAACRAVQLELSLLPLYGGQELWTYFIAELGRQGFELWTVLPGFVDAETGRTLQIDAIFVRA